MTAVALSVITLGPYIGTAASFPLGLSAVYPPEVGCAVLQPQYEIHETVVTRTDVALAYLARSLVEGLAIKIVAFQIGADGYDPVFFTRPLPVTDTTRINALVYEGPVEAESASSDGMMMSYTCRVPGDLRVALGEVALVGEILSSPLNPSEVGTRFPYAIGHCPAVVKHLRSAATFRMVLTG